MMDLGLSSTHIFNFKLLEGHHGQAVRVFVYGAEGHWFKSTQSSDWKSRSVHPAINWYLIFFRVDES